MVGFQTFNTADNFCFFTQPKSCWLKLWTVKEAPYCRCIRTLKGALTLSYSSKFFTQPNMVFQPTSLLRTHGNGPRPQVNVKQRRERERRGK